MNTLIILAALTQLPVEKQAVRMIRGHSAALTNPLEKEESMAGYTITRSGNFTNEIKRKYRLEYNSWCAMKSRCENPKQQHYMRYGGRGIVVCERWNSFWKFVEDMGRRPSAQHSIDRIDVNGNYEPGNCRWATSAEQHRNMGTNVFLEIDGASRCISEWSEISGVPVTSIGYRVRRGWNAKRAVFEKPKGGRGRKLQAFGRSQTLTEWCREFGAPPGRVSMRIRRGMTLEDALSR